MNAIFSAREVATLLGIARSGAYSAMDLDGAVRRGLPVSTFEKVTALIAPEDARFRNSVVPRATLARRASSPSKRLSPEESDRVVRLARLWQAALSCWRREGDARAFLTEPHALLQGRTPLDVAAGSEVGAREVEAIIGRLVHGVAL